MTVPTRDATDVVGMQLVRLKKSMESVRTQVLQAGGHGLEGSGLAVLMHLTTAGPMRTSTLAERLGLDPSTTSRHVAALERSGHVERVADPDDGRAWLVQASATGVRAFEDTRALRNALVGRVLEGWSADEVATLARSLTRFNDAVSDLVATGLTSGLPPQGPSPTTPATTPVTTPVTTPPSSTTKDPR